MRYYKMVRYMKVISTMGYIMEKEELFIKMVVLIKVIIKKGQHMAMGYINVLMDLNTMDNGFMVKNMEKDN